MGDPRKVVKYSDVGVNPIRRPAKSPSYSQQLRVYNIVDPILVGHSAGSRLDWFN